MKFLFFGFLLALIAGCASTKPVSRTTYCMHPAIRGGSPFELPEDAKFDNIGGISFTIDEKAVTLWGSYCVAYPKESRE